MDLVLTWLWPRSASTWCLPDQAAVAYTHPTPGLDGDLAEHSYQWVQTVRDSSHLNILIAGECFLHSTVDGNLDGF